MQQGCSNTYSSTKTMSFELLILYLCKQQYSNHTSISGRHERFFQNISEERASSISFIYHKRMNGCNSKMHVNFFHYKIRIWNYQLLYAECILKVDKSYLLRDTSFVHRNGLGSPKEWSRIMGCVWLQTLPKLTVMSRCSTVMELVPRYALCYTWVTFSPTYIAERYDHQLF